jgi:hypothetical protein
VICWVSEVLIFLVDIIEQSDFLLDFYQRILVRSIIYNFAHRPEANIKEGGFRSGTSYVVYEKYQYNKDNVQFEQSG